MSFEATNQKEQLVNETSAALPLVTIVGRPNVGKSTLFNRLIGQRRSIVGDEPGITRDRIYGEAEWSGQRFAVVDTGGIVPDDEAVIPANILKQASLAIDEAALLVWVVDARSGPTPLDEELARLLRSTGKPVIIAANKVDVHQLQAEAGDFYRFGFDHVLAVSAEHGDGVGELLETAAAELGAWHPERSDGDETSNELRLAIVGRPNVGKSSLLNRLTGAERSIVSPIPGTTRDSVDTLVEQSEHTFRIIDTAGIRRKGKTEALTEKLAVVMARKSLERADVAIVLVDASAGVTGLDANIAGYAFDAGCSIIIAVNKWDAIEKETNTAAEFEKQLRQRMKFLEWAPVITISALSG